MSYCNLSFLLSLTDLVPGSLSVSLKGLCQGLAKMKFHPPLTPSSLVSTPEDEKCLHSMNYVLFVAHCDLYLDQKII